MSNFDWTTAVFNSIVMIPPILLITFIVLTIKNWKKKNTSRIVFLVFAILMGLTVLLEIGIFVLLMLAVQHM